MSGAAVRTPSPSESLAPEVQDVPLPLRLAVDTRATRLHLLGLQQAVVDLRKGLLACVTKVEDTEKCLWEGKRSLADLQRRIYTVSTLVNGACTNMGYEERPALAANESVQAWWPMEQDVLEDDEYWDITTVYGIAEVSDGMFIPEVFAPTLVADEDILKCKQAEFFPRHPAVASDAELEHMQYEGYAAPSGDEGTTVAVPKVDDDPSDNQEQADFGTGEDGGSGVSTLGVPWVGLMEARFDRSCVPTGDGEMVRLNTKGYKRVADTPWCSSRFRPPPRKVVLRSAPEPTGDAKGHKPPALVKAKEEQLP